MGSGRVSPRVATAVTGFLAFCAISGYATLSIIGFVATFNASGSPPSMNQAYIYVTAALGSLVGGVFALTFERKDLPPQHDGKELLFSNIRSLADVAEVRGSGGGGEIIASAYVIAYTALGVVAIIVWMAKPDVAADSVKTLSATFIGMAIPIARGFFAG